MNILLFCSLIYSGPLSLFYGSRTIGPSNNFVRGQFGPQKLYKIPIKLIILI